MVLIHILTNHKTQAEEIADFLVSKKLILTAVLQDQVVTKYRQSENKIISEQQTLIMGKTKALLFKEIDNQLRAKYKSNMPVLYSLPIVNMDWEQADMLVKETAVV